MKIKNTLFSVILISVLSITTSFSQSDSRGNGFFNEGALLTVKQVPDLLNSGLISVDYNGNGCADCDTELSYDKDTKIFAGVNSIKLEVSDIAYLKKAPASVFVDEDNKILKIRLFEIPSLQ